MIYSSKNTRHGFAIRFCWASLVTAYAMAWGLGAVRAEQEAETQLDAIEKSIVALETKITSGTATEANAEAPETPTQPPVVAHFHLTGSLSETPASDLLGLSGAQTPSLHDVLLRLGQARRDEQVKAVVLTIDRFSLGFAQIEELRAALSRLREANKRVLVHAEDLRTPSYALLAGASDFCVTPQSDLWLTGLYSESLYAKDLLDKIGIEADFLHMGDYKSAAEMLTQTGPSTAALENTNWLLDGLYESLVDMIAESRGKTPAEVRCLIDDAPYLAERAREVGLLDSVLYRDGFMAEIRKEFGANAVIDNRYGQKKPPELNLSNPFAILSLFSEMAASHKRPSGRPEIALVYIDGAIVSGYGQANPFGASSGAYSGDIRKALERAAQEDSIKAVVLRIDSPGGSALASEVIWNAVRTVRAKKPLVVSMGNVAASGGYYVACGADRIFADAMTITGSIGVVGGKLVTAGLWERLGVNWRAEKRGANADLLNSSARFSQEQHDRIERYMREIYSTFKEHVVKGRSGCLTKPIDEIAGGRVYTGKQAQALGLVDEIGGLAEAVKCAAEMAKVEAYDVRTIPEPLDLLTQLVEGLSEDAPRPTDLKVRLADAVGLAPGALALLERLDPQRAAAVLRTIRHIELIRDERVTLMMPQEWVFY